MVGAVTGVVCTNEVPELGSTGLVRMLMAVPCARFSN